MSEPTAWVTGAVAAMLLAVIVTLGLIYSSVNYDNKRMQFGYCETYMPGNPQRLLVKCPK